MPKYDRALKLGSWQAIAPCAAISIFFSQLAFAQGAQIVAAMAAHEAVARQQQAHYSFISEERSTRTEGHLWREKVIETNDGALRRLLAVDGKPLTPLETDTEDRRINATVADPRDFRRREESRKDDETHTIHLLEMLPKAFLLSPAGMRDGCTQFSFRADPAFKPSTYEERIMVATEGTVSVKEPADRLCRVDAQIVQTVQFGFGLLGHVNRGGHFGYAKLQLDDRNWKMVQVSIHLDGRILMMKSLSRDQEVTRSDIQLVPQELSLLEASQMSRR